MKKFGYLRTACGVPVVHLGDSRANSREMITICEQALAENVSVLVFPELSVTGYTLADLFFQKTLQEEADLAVEALRKWSEGKALFFVVGAPVALAAGLYNCGVAICNGEILGLLPKTYLPENQEFYEKRWFRSSSSLVEKEVEYLGQTVPVGSRLLFCQKGWPEVKIGIEICEDLWSVIPPSNYLSIAGATVILNLSASNELTGKEAYRCELIKQQSARCNAAYLYASGGYGESTTDLVFSGDAMIFERGTLLSRSTAFSFENQLIVADVDLEVLSHDRQIQSSYNDSRRLIDGDDYRLIEFDAKDANDCRREIEPLPFVPGNEKERHQRCQEIIQIQTMGLGTRVKHIGDPAMIVGVSGGLDSTLALLVCAHTCDTFGIDRRKIHGITMPGFGTTDRTYDNAVNLIKALGASFHEINITKTVTAHFEDIGHDLNNHDTTYENAQARERTQILMDMANQLDGIVVGTGDLSELALGWATYNGDHMSMYGVNASVPKTLIRSVVKSFADEHSEEKIRQILCDILATPVSPELLPPDVTGAIAQKTEDLVGPYELHDFFIFHTLRNAFTPEKIYYLAQKAFSGQYDAQTIKKWMLSFYKRFFTQQFKRSCIPDGPKVGSVSLSPRGDWRMPSDAEATAYIQRVEALKS